MRYDRRPLPKNISQRLILGFVIVCPIIVVVCLGNSAFYAWAVTSSPHENTERARFLSHCYSYWAAALMLFEILGVIYLIAKRKGRTEDSTCLSCGYDLTGNTSGVCPECGTALPHK